MPLILAALLLLLRATIAAAETTIILDPAAPSDVTVTRRTTDRSKRIYLAVPKSTAVTIRAMKPCTALLSVGGVIPWATLPVGAVVCLPDGEYPAIDPPKGLAGITIRAVNPGKASVPCIYLDNAVAIEGIRTGPDVWTRASGP